MSLSPLFDADPIPRPLVLAYGVGPRFADSSCIPHRYDVLAPSEHGTLLRITRADDHGQPLRDVPTVGRFARPASRENALDQVMEL